MATVDVYLDGKPDNNFSAWFQNPGGHKWTTMHVPQMCTVEGVRIHFETPEEHVQSAVSLIKEWIGNANAYAHAKHDEMNQQRARAQKEKEELERRRQALQDKINRS